MKNTIELIKELVLAYSTKDFSKVERLVNSDDIEWGFFIEQLLKHKLAPLAFVVLKPFFDDAIPMYIGEWLSTQYYLNKYRTKLSIEMIKPFIEKIETRNIPAVLIKGLSIDSMLYEQDYIKTISDVDVLINEEDADALKAVLDECGFMEGNYNYKTNRIECMPRKRKILLCLTRDHMSEYLVHTGDTIFPAVKVDVSFNNDWIDRGMKSCFDSAIKEPMWVKIENNLRIPTMRYTYHFLYLIMHLYRHACSYRFIERGIGVRLSMFNDIMLFYKKYSYIIRREFKIVLNDKKVGNQVEWVLFHLDQIYKSNFCGELGIRYNLKSMNSVHGKNNEMMCWKGGIEDRLWCKNEKKLFE